jgi:mono/diheme cytochrome c family protein
MIKKLLLSSAVLIGVLAAGAPAYFFLTYPTVRPAPDVKAPDTPEAIERGRYLAEAMTGCAPCHSPIDESRPGDFPVADMVYAGRTFSEEMGFPGTIVAANLTPDPETGIGRWTDGEIVRAMREGIGRDGRALFPLMNYPHYRDLSDEDVLAIVAYLRTQTPIRHDPGRTSLNFPVNFLIRTVPRPVDGSPAGYPPPGVERGRMMMNVMLCGECHTPSEQGQPVAGMALAGGSPMTGAWGTVYAANITSHPSAGIGAFSDEDLRRVFREGKNRAGRELWVMPWSVTRNLTDEDLDSLIAALREVPPNPNLVPAPQLNQGTTAP